MESSRSRGVVGHTNLVCDLGFSPGGGLLASSGADGRVIVWDLARGAPLRTISLPPSLTPDGIDPVAETLHFRSEGEIWTLAPFARFSVASRRVLEHREGIAGRAISPDGRMLLGGWGATLRAFEIATGAEIWSESVEEHLCDVRFHPGGGRIVVATATGLEFRSAETGQREGTIGDRWPSGLEARLALSPDGRLLAAEYGPNPTDRKILVRALEGGERLWSAARQAWSLRFSPSGDLLATGDKDGVVRLYRARDGSVVSEHKVRTGFVGCWLRCLAFSPDGRILAVGADDGVVRLLNVATGRRLPDLGRQALPVRRLAFCERSLKVFFARDDGRVAARRVRGGGLEWERRDTKGAAAGLHAVEGDVLLFADGREIHRFDGETGRSVGQPLLLDRPFYSFAASPDGRHLATGHEGGLVRLGEAETDRLLWAWRSPEGGDHASRAVGGLAVSTRGHVLAIAGAHTAVLSAADGAELLQIPGDMRDSQCCFSRDGEVAAVADWTGAVEIFRTEDWSRIGSTGPDGDDATALSLSRSGRLWACGTAYLNSAWMGAAERREKRTLLFGHTNAVIASAFSGNGRYLATGSYDGSIRLWEVPTGRPFAEWPDP